MLNLNSCEIRRSFSSSAAARFAKNREGDPSGVIRETAATMAGLFEHQRETALRVVNMPSQALTTKNDTIRPAEVAVFALRTHLEIAGLPSLWSNDISVGKRGRRERKMKEQHRSGLVTTSVLGMILVGLISGALVGVVLGAASARPLLLAILCAIVAAILSLSIRNLVLDRNAAATAPLGIRNLVLDRTATTTLPLGMKFMWVVIASLIGGLAGHELAIDVTEPPPLPLVGALSGLVASVLIASYAITIFMLRNPLSASSE